MNQLTLAFDINESWVITLLILPSLLYIPMSFVTASLYNNLLVHHVVYIAAIIQLVGCWIRIFAFYSNQRFWPILIGTAIYVLALPLSANAVSLIANLWFPDDERATATSLMSLSMPLGTLISLLITGIVAAGLDETDPVDCFNRIEEVTII